MTKLSDEARKVWVDAAELIEQGGWCQRTFVDGTRHCISGALSSVSGFDAPSVRAYREAHSKLYDKVGMSISRWNDDTCTSKQEAIDMLLKAANG